MLELCMARTQPMLISALMLCTYYIALVVDDILIIFNLFQLEIRWASNGPYFHSRSFDDFRILEFWTPSNLAVEQEKKVQELDYSRLKVLWP